MNLMKQQVQAAMMYQDEIEALKNDRLSPKGKLARRKLQAIVVNDEDLWKELQQALRGMNLRTNYCVGEVLNSSLVEEIGLAGIERNNLIRQRNSGKETSFSSNIMATFSTRKKIEICGEGAPKGYYKYKTKKLEDTKGQGAPSSALEDICKAFSISKVKSKLRTGSMGVGMGDTAGGRANISATLEQALGLSYQNPSTRRLGDDAELNDMLEEFPARDDMSRRKASQVAENSKGLVVGYCH